MTLKIERFRARVRLSGELRSEYLDQVKTELQTKMWGFGWKGAGNGGKTHAPSGLPARKS